MYAVIATGGKQYRVAKGDTLQIEKLDDEAGSSVEFDQVLLIADSTSANIGTPYINGAKVTAEIVNQAKGEKINIIKFRRRKHYMRKQGHRQYITEVKIKDIQV